MMNTSFSRRFLNMVDRKINLIMVAPAVLILGGLVIYPFLYNINLSVHDAGLLNIRSGNFRVCWFKELRDYLQGCLCSEGLAAHILFLGDHGLFTVDCWVDRSPGL